MLLVGSPGSELAQSLLPAPDVKVQAGLLLSGRLQSVGRHEWILYKPRWGAFFKTCLEEHLRGLDVTTLVFAGCNFSELSAHIDLRGQRARFPSGCRRGRNVPVRRTCSDGTGEYRSHC